jgi:hypothetical protein
MSDHAELARQLVAFVIENRAALRASSGRRTGKRPRRPLRHRYRDLHIVPLLAPARHDEAGQEQPLDAVPGVASDDPVDHFVNLRRHPTSTTDPRVVVPGPGVPMTRIVAGQATQARRGRSLRVRNDAPLMAAGGPRHS